jgi:hypothetical protein
MRGSRPYLLVVVVAVVSSAVLAPVAGAAGPSDSPVEHSVTQESSTETVLTAPTSGHGISSLESSSDAGSTTADNHVPECAANPPDDFTDPEGGTSETIGWVDGYWYNEPLDIEGELENPLSESQVDDLIARTAARVETLRCLTLEQVPSFGTSTLEEQIAQSQQRYADISQERRNFLNAQMQTMLLVGTERDAVEIQAQQQGSFGIAYYFPGQDRMMFIVEERGEIRIDETTLAHELVHALQFQNIDLSGSYGRTTNDESIAGRTTIEGDASLVDQLYEQRCDEWDNECLRFEPDVPEPANWGQYVSSYTPYSTPLVAETKQEEGWEGVNELLESPPESTLEAIYPERYGEFERANVTVQDQSKGDWQRVETPLQRNPNYDIMGQQGVVGMLVAPNYEQGSVIADAGLFFEEHAGGQLNYDIPSARGWRGDKLYAYTFDSPYVNDSEGRGSVWKTAWENASEATEFRGAYEELIEFRNGQQSEDYQNVYTFEQAENYTMALGLEQREDRLTIVTAPTVEDLTEIHDIELVEAPEPTPTPTPEGTPTGEGSGTDGDGMAGGQTNGTDTETSDRGVSATATETASDDSGAGFGIVVGALAFAVTALLAYRRKTEWK